MHGTFYYLCAISRYLIDWTLRGPMTEVDVEILLQRARETFPEAHPGGPQFIARDFKEFIRISGMTHVRTSPYYPQSKGKMDRPGVPCRWTMRNV